MAGPVQALGGFISPGSQKTQIAGVGTVETGPEDVENLYQAQVESALGLRQRETEARLFAEQAKLMREAAQGTTAATQAARAQAREAGLATLGAARSQAGAAGTQTAALGALGAGQAQQYGMAAAGQVQALEEQRNAVARAQMAELLRQQAQAQYGLERADIATDLSAGRALLAPEIELQARYGQEEARRQQQLYAAGLSAGGTAVGTVLGGR